ATSTTRPTCAPMASPIWASGEVTDMDAVHPDLPLPDGEAVGQARARLADHAAEARHWHLADLFRGDPQRFRGLSHQACGLLMDLSKQRLTTDTLALLVELARQCGLEGWIDALFGGAPVNWTEQRA